ncbi:hypothetical protein UFOVP1325_13 [uncultured Caudovirales phage]|uniref:Uncharacterized protein n=1 Tax=uncultured Caudovirales phage TaxID=2100421 RepID=A0A6J5SES9_9CAUD|nr:hypothetical protein UFOVP1325_13 [uncultured Caudovirales phage]CAB4212529.1 hypothetical protein UFOVP1435_17 [uncultured Caudovirales phage]CAB5227904.1 hypothetical protein UFOVP1530_7 [uncultured Caudovirales phage]
MYPHRLSLQDALTRADQIALSQELQVPSAIRRRVMPLGDLSIQIAWFHGIMADQAYRHRRWKRKQIHPSTRRKLNPADRKRARAETMRRYRAKVAAERAARLGTKKPQG